MKLPTERQIHDCKKPTPYALTNKILYDLCRRNFFHKEDEKILAKVLIIGRTYAVALDRHKKEKDVSVDFYLDKVVPTFKKSSIDAQIAKFAKHKRLTKELIPELLKMHYSFTKQLNKITGHDKRSFVSKYLHFHLPHLFYIYDSRARKAMPYFIRKPLSAPAKLTREIKVDNSYARFFWKCYDLSNQIKQKYHVQVSPREVDNLLLKL